MGNHQDSPIANKPIALLRRARYRALSLVQRSLLRQGRGPMAEWLRRGLQILARRFDSGSGLHISLLAQMPVTGSRGLATGAPL